ncbi:MAG: hypothetical protein LLF94_05205 [Chlamydiales bacterium]|nr:hypothetical protein [Chlamydiales bacterium]
MKIKIQKALFANPALVQVVSGSKEVSRKTFARNVLKHAQKDKWIPMYLLSLESNVHARYKKEATSLLKRFVRLYNKQKASLELSPTILEQIHRVEKALDTRPKFKKSEVKNIQQLPKVMREIDRLEIPLSEFAQRANDFDFITKMKKRISHYCRCHPNISNLRDKLISNMDLSFRQERIVDLPTCQKSLLVPHPTTNWQIGLYFEAVMQHKAPVLVSLCSPYESPDVIAFWEDRVVVDSQGKEITCTKKSETILYQGPVAAVIRNEKRANDAIVNGGVNPEALFPRIVERVIELQRDDAVFTTTHLHYENWPDHQEAPDIQALEVLLDRRNQLATLDDLCLVNCKATIGRSGLFFFSDYGRNLVSQMAKEGVPFDEMKLNFAEMVNRVRIFRPILSGNPVQLGQAFQIIADHYEKLKVTQ